MTQRQNMSRATVELDFFGMEKDMTSSSSSNSRPHKLLPRRRSFRDLQSAISKINPQLLKSVIASGSVNNQNPELENLRFVDSKKSFSMPSTPKGEHTRFPALPLYSLIIRPAAAAAALKNPQETAPLTIFYNGTVAVFDVPPDKAETILRIAEKGLSRTFESTEQKVAVVSANQQQLLNADLPIARRKSLQRFLEKRKERLTVACPYAGTPSARF